jgi:hypothetical protein
MLHTVAVWLAVAAFAGAGLFNAIGTRGTEEDFVRWGYPRWWCRISAGLEIGTAGLIASPDGRTAGIILGATIVAFASLTVLRHRDYSHIAPLSVFAALLALSAATA